MLGSLTCFHPHYYLFCTFHSLSRTVSALRGCRPVWPLPSGETVPGRRQTQSLPRTDRTRSGGRRCHHLVVLPLLPFLLSPAAFHHAAVEWPHQCAALYWQVDRAVRGEHNEGWGVKCAGNDKGCFAAVFEVIWRIFLKIQLLRINIALNSLVTKVSSDLWIWIIFRDDDK